MMQVSVGERWQYSAHVSIGPRIQAWTRECDLVRLLLHLHSHTLRHRIHFAPILITKWKLLCSTRCQRWKICGRCALWEGAEDDLHLPTPPSTVDVESSLAFLVAKSWLLLSDAGAITTAWLSSSSLPRCKEEKKNDFDENVLRTSGKHRRRRGRVEEWFSWLCNVHRMAKILQKWIDLVRELVRHLPPFRKYPNNLVKIQTKCHSGKLMENSKHFYNLASAIRFVSGALTPFIKWCCCQHFSLDTTRTQTDEKKAMRFCVHPWSTVCSVHCAREPEFNIHFRHRPSARLCCDRSMQ